MITAVILSIAAIYVLVLGTRGVQRQPTYEDARPPSLGGVGASTGERQEHGHQTHADEEPLQSKPSRPYGTPLQGDYTKTDPIKSDDGLPEGGFLTPIKADPTGGFSTDLALSLENMNNDATPVEKDAAATYTANAVTGTGEAVVNSFSAAFNHLSRGHYQRP